MKKEDIIRKLTSRKFWVAVIGFVTALLIAFNVADTDVETVASVISAFGVLIAYILGESYADGNGGDDKEEEDDV